MGFFSKLFDPGRDDRRAAASLAQQGIIKGGSATGPGGITAGFDFSGGRGSITSGLGSFQPALEQMQGASANFLNQAQGGLPPELAALAEGTIGRLGSIDVNRLSNESDFAGFGDIFQSALGTAQADPFDLGAGISERLRALSERRNQRSVNKMFDRLKSTGNLTSSAGIQRAGDVENQLFEQGLQFDLAGLQAGQGIQRDAFARALGSSGAREGIGARQFGEEFGLEQLGGQRALQQFGVGGDMFSKFLQNQAQGTQLGLATNASAMATSQLPLAFLQALQGSTGQASNSLFAASGINQQNAAMAKSPFLEALKAAGSFASGIAPGGFFGNTPAGG
jgi:hypothetical protein